MTTKAAGASCPACRYTPCSEYAMLGEAPKWTCLGCGASGFLSGAFMGRKPVEAPKGRTGAPP